MQVRQYLKIADRPIGIGGDGIVRRLDIPSSYLRLNELDEKLQLFVANVYLHQSYPR